MNQLRTNCIDRAKNETQDCLVIGAGINGAVAAAALAEKGAKVTVIDKGDFASVTSQESSNLAWGGIKYLENFEFPLVWDLCGSRNHLKHSYPSQVHEIRFFTTIARNFRKPRWMIYCGALLYWFMGRCHMRPPRLLSVKKIRKEAPMVNAEALGGGLEYSDCYFVENDTRFAFSFIRRVLQKSCNGINYMELISARWQNDRWQCHLMDHTSGETIALNTKSIVNAAGPFADKINTLLNINSPYKHIFSKGAHIIVPQISTVCRVLTFFASDGRLFFMIPMSDRTCIGTTDTRVDNEVATPTDDDVNFLLENANTLLKLETPLTPKDVIAKRCGVRPLVVKKELDVGNAEWTALSRKHEIDIQPDRNLCSIYGGKLTDCINVGEEAAEIVSSFGITLFDGLESWYGEPSKQKRDSFMAQCQKLKLTEEQSTRLWRRYGRDAFQCVDKIRNDPAMGDKVFDKFLRAELYHIAEKEMVIHLEDFLRRRSRLALIRHRAALRCDPGLPEAAKILFGINAEAEIKHYFG